MVGKSVLITGCSTGVGRATAERLARGDFLVYASARRPEVLDELAQLGCKTLALDVTEDSSMVEAVRQIVDTCGAVDVLVNNAGLGEYSSVEEAPIESLRRQLETNVVGLTRLIQLVLPHMRARGWGRIVNVGSMSGKVTLPSTAFYSASKYAVEALTDALRFEVRPFGIGVSLIEPGAIKTGFDEAAIGPLSEASDSSPYDRFNRSAAKAMVGSSGLARSPEDVAHVVESAIRARKPKSRYRVGLDARLMLGARKVLSDRVLDRMLRSQFKPPAPAAQAGAAAP